MAAARKPPSRRPATLARRYGVVKNARIQVLLFPRSDWATEDAKVWAALNGFKASDVDITDSYVRIHQSRSKGKAGRVRTIPWGIGGIRAVAEWR